MLFINIMESYYNTLYELSGNTTLGIGDTTCRTLYKMFDSKLVKYGQVIKSFEKDDNIDTIINLSESTDKICSIIELRRTLDAKSKDNLKNLIIFFKTYKQKEVRGFNKYMGVLKNENPNLGSLLQTIHQKRPQAQPQQQPQQNDGFDFLKGLKGDGVHEKNMEKFVLKHFSPIRAMIIYLKFCLFGMIIKRDNDIGSLLNDDNRDIDQKMNDVLSRYKKTIAGKIKPKIVNFDEIKDDFYNTVAKYIDENDEHSDIVEEFTNKFTKDLPISTRREKLREEALNKLPRIVYFKKSYQHMYKIMNLTIEGNDDLSERIKVIIEKVYPMVLDAVRGENREQERMRLLEMISITESKLELVDDTKFEEDNVFDNKHREKQQKYYTDIIVNIIKNIHEPEKLKSELQKLYVDETKHGSIMNAIVEHNRLVFGNIMDNAIMAINVALGDGDVFQKTNDIFLKLIGIVSGMDGETEVRKIFIINDDDGTITGVKEDIDDFNADDVYISIFNALGGLNHGKAERDCVEALKQANADIESMERGDNKQIQANEAKIAEMEQQIAANKQEQDRLKAKVKEEEELKLKTVAKLADVNAKLSEKINRLNELVGEGGNGGEIAKLRKEIVALKAKIAELEAINKTSVQMIAKLNRGIQKMNETNTKILKNMEKFKNTVDQKNTEKDEKLRQCNEELEELQLKLQEKKEQINENNVKIAKLESVKKQDDVNIKELQESGKKLDGEHKEKIAELEAKQIKTNEEIQRIKVVNEKLQKDKDALAKQVEELTNQKKECEEEKGKLKQAKTICENEKGKLEKANKDCEGEKGKLEQAKTDCETEKGGLKKQLEELGQQITEKREKIDEHNEIVRKTKEQHDITLEKAKRDYETEKQQIEKEKNGKIEELTSKITELNEIIRKKRDVDRIKRLESQVKQLETQNTTKQSVIDGHERTIAVLRNKNAEEMRDANTSYESLQTTNEGLKKDKDALALENQNKETQIKSLTEQLDKSKGKAKGPDLATELRHAQNEVNVYEKENEELKKAKEQLERQNKILKDKNMKLKPKPK